MNILRKKYWLTFSLLSVAVQLCAQEGRWYSLDESTSSPASGFMLILILVVGIIAGSFLIAMINSDDRNKDDKGCAIGFILIIIVLGIIAAIANA